MFSLVLKGEPRQFKDHCCAAMTSQVNTCSELGASPLEGSTDQRIFIQAEAASRLGLIQALGAITHHLGEVG
jgi:hypothetical protein